MLDKSDKLRHLGLGQTFTFNGHPGRLPSEPTTTHHLPSGVGFHRVGGVFPLRRQP